MSVKKNARQCLDNDLWSETVEFMEHSGPP